MPKPAWSRIALATLTLTLFGCEEVPARAQREQSPTVERMTHHFEQATRARDALVRGDLRAAGRAARELADADAPARLRAAPLEAMRGAAREVEAARDIETASRAFGDVARACGECHRTMGAQVEASDAPPPRGGDLRARMRRHFWATDRLWDGLMVPDADRFAAGAAELIDAPLFPSAPATAQTVSPEARTVANRIREHARDAQRAPDDEGRAHAYGDILGTCADCHRLVGVGGPVAPVAL